MLLDSLKFFLLYSEVRRRLVLLVRETRRASTAHASKNTAADDPSLSLSPSRLSPASSLETSSGSSALVQPHRPYEVLASFATLICISTISSE